jgi:hypothetical protein
MIKLKSEMSKYNVPILLKAAIYDAYDGKCFYSGIPIAFQDTEIDHLIPESYADRLDSLKIEYGLAQDFQINSIENLVPTTSASNKRKGNSLFNKRALLYYLNITQSHKDKITNLHLDYKQNNKKGTTIKALQTSMERNILSPKDACNAITEVLRARWLNSSIKLNIPICFADSTVSEITLNSDYKNYEHRPFEAFQDDRGLILVNEKGQEIHVRNLNEWKNGLGKEYYPMTNWDIRMSAYFTYLNGLLTMLSSSYPADRSFIDGCKLSDLIKKTRTSFLKTIDTEDKLTATTIEEMITAGDAEICKESEISVTIRAFGFLVTITDVFHADLTQNGIEDIFCYVWFNADGGSMGWGEVAIFSKNSKHRECELELQEF